MRAVAQPALQIIGKLLEALLMKSLPAARLIAVSVYGKTRREDEALDRWDTSDAGLLTIFTKKYSL